MKKNATHMAIAAAMVFGLAACGGGGGSDPVGTPDPDPSTPGEPGPGDVATKTVNGAVAPTAEGGTVCLDADRDLACGADEWSTVVQAGGVYALEVPEETDVAKSLIVGQFAAESQYGASTHNDMVPRAPFTLATPGSDTSQMGTLSTLVAIKMQADPALTTEQAMEQVRADLGLPADLSGVDPAEIARLEAAALPALRQSANAKYLAGGSTDLGAATIAAAPSVVKVLQKYIDPATLKLWDLVGEKTLVSESVSDAAPQECEIHALPEMHVDVGPTIPGTIPVTSKEEYEDGFIRFADSFGATPGAAIETEIRGRGNTTWNREDYLKKPYRLKLPKPGMSLLGMPEARNWALLANHSDKSSLRNALAFCLGKQMNLRYAQPSRFVEFYFNGEYQGVYQLTPHTEAHENRVDIGPDWPEEDVFNPDAGWLVEMDARVIPPESVPEDDPWFQSAGPLLGGVGRGYVIKSDVISGDLPPDESDLIVADVMGEIEDEINAMEAAFASPDPVAASEPLVDLEEMIDFYLINEFLRNSDAFWSSTYLHRPSNGKIFFGPLWDFDLSAGNDWGKNAEGVPYNDPNTRWCPEGWFVRDVATDSVEAFLEAEKPWPEDDVRNTKFTRLMVARWEYLSGRLPDLWTYIDQASSNMADAQVRNFTIGRGDLAQRVWPNYTVFPTYAEEVNYLTEWLQARKAWMDERIASYNATIPGCAAWESRWSAYSE